VASRSWNGWTIAGLLAALGGPLVLASPPAQSLYELAGAQAIYVGQAVLWALVFVVIAILRFGERQPLAAIGLVPPRGRSILLGLGIGVGVFAVLAALAAVLSHFALFDNKEASEVVLDWPLWFRIFVAASAGVIEETLYRGYAIERLAKIVGGHRIAAVISLAAFALAHVPFWGWGSLATPLVGGAFFAILYLWSRDLVACMVAHSLIDLVGIVVLPALSR
jgi:membrane protease YdiL (CAAX protease family)